VLKSFPKSKTCFSKLSKNYHLMASQPKASLSVAPQPKAVSTTAPVSSSVPTSLPPATRPPARPPVSRNTGTPVYGSKNQASGNDPEVTNVELISMFRQVKEKLERNDQVNSRILQEMEELRRPRNAAEIVTPRVLDFDTPQGTQRPQQSVPRIPATVAASAQQTTPSYPSREYTGKGPASTHQGSSGHFQQGTQPSGTAGMTSSQPIWIGDSIPMNTTTTIPTGNPGSCGYGPSQRIPTSQQGGNLYQTTSFTPNYDPLQNAGIDPVLAKELQKIKDMISSVPGIVKPIKEVPDGSHKTSRFAPPICFAEIPKRFTIPSMKLYDGSTDPEEHVAQYRERMEINPIPEHLKEACLCKGFGSTLTGSALKWLLSLPPYSISSFSQLINMFNGQFSCSRTFEKSTSDLYRVTQSSNETLRDFITKFTKESLEIPNLDMATAVEAFKSGLTKDSQFYDDLVMNPCRNLDEVRSRAIRFIRLEDDKRIHDRCTRNDPKKDQGSYRYNKSKPYSKPEQHSVNLVEEDSDSEDYPKLTHYCFSVDTGGLIFAMRDLGDKARWPRRSDKNQMMKDKSKWCLYHEDFGHITEDCIALRKEISYLLSKGHLKELLGRKKSKTSDPQETPEKATPPPLDAKVIY
jgi:Retrotransposon gag protein